MLMICRDRTGRGGGPQVHAGAGEHSGAGGAGRRGASGAGHRHPPGAALRRRAAHLRAGGRPRSEGMFVRAPHSSVASLSTSGARVLARRNKMQLGWGRLCASTGPALGAPCSTPVGLSQSKRPSRFTGVCSSTQAESGNVVVVDVAPGADLSPGSLFLTQVHTFVCCSRDVCSGCGT